MWEHRAKILKTSYLFLKILTLHESVDCSNLYNQAQNLTEKMENMILNLQEYKTQLPGLVETNHQYSVTTRRFGVSRRSVPACPDDYESLIEDAEEILNMTEQRIQDDPSKSINKNLAFKELPFNYRPPSVYGNSIPNNDKVYNANLNLPLTSYLQGFVVQYVVSKWDALKKDLIEKFTPEKTNGLYDSLCEESYTYTDVNGAKVSTKKNFKTYDVSFGEKNGECMAKVAKVKSGQSGQTCIKVEALLSDGSSISSQSVTLEELNNRQSTLEYNVIESKVAVLDIPECFSIIEQNTGVKPIVSNDDPAVYKNKVSERTFDLSDIYIVTMRPGLFHFRLTINDAR